ncbi:MAG: CAP domain-containing protein [Tannerella sp.]|jgi:uncharacterized protein YkwD|nr:CAP domain-containing protein [Tannerella sp.]
MQTFTALRLPPDNMLFPGRLEIDTLKVTYYKGHILGYRSTVIDRSNIASVSIGSWVLFANVIIETIGGKRIVANDFKIADAKEVVRLLSNEANTSRFTGKTSRFAPTPNQNTPTPNNYYSGFDAKSFFASANLQHKISNAMVDVDLLDAAVFWFTNIERQKFQLKQLQFHERLRQAATLHSEQMKRHNFFSHDNAFDARYRTLTDRINFIKDNSGQDFICCAENIADYPIISTKERFRIEHRNGTPHYVSTFGREILPYSYYEYAKIVVEGWMNSPGHRENILNPDYEYLGCGCENYEKQGMLYFKLTQNFGGTLVDSKLLIK